MFRKTIQNIESSRHVGSKYPTQTHGYNTQRYERYTPSQQDQQNSIQRRTLTSDHFHQLKKNQNKPSELIIRECDVNELNNFKKNTPRQMEEQNSYQFNGSSSKKQKIGVGSRKAYDSSYREPLKEYYLQRDNTPRNQRNEQRYSTNVEINSTSTMDYQDLFENLKQFMIQTHQEYSNQLKKTKNQTKSIKVECMGQLQSLASQISKELTKQNQQMFMIKKNRNQLQKELKYLKESFNSFVKDNQQKIQSIVLDLHGNKKSKNIDEFGVDLKSSSSHCNSGGVGTSMSMNFQNDNVNFKLYNQMSAQLQMLKNQLQKCRQKIESIQKDTKTIQLTKQPSIKSQQQKTQNKTKTIDLKQVEKLIISKFNQQFKKNSMIQKLNEIDLKTTDLYRLYQDTDANIKGMNTEFTRVINGTVIKKQKMLQAKVNVIEQKLNEIFQKVSPLNQIIKQQIKLFIQDKSSKIKVVKTRQPTSQQKSAIQSLKQSNITYMVDEQGYLMDQSGSYILEQSSKGKSKIKIQSDMYYLLECQGIQIKTV